MATNKHGKLCPAVREVGKRLRNAVTAVDNIIIMMISSLERIVEKHWYILTCFHRAADPKISCEPLGLWAEGRGDPSAFGSVFWRSQETPQQADILRQNAKRLAARLWRTCGEHVVDVEEHTVLKILKLETFWAATWRVQRAAEEVEGNAQRWKADFSVLDFCFNFFPSWKTTQNLRLIYTQKGWLKENNNEEKEDATSLAQAICKSCTAGLTTDKCQKVPSLKRLERSRGSLLQDWSQKQWREMARIWMFVVPFADYCALV